MSAIPFSSVCLVSLLRRLFFSTRCHVVDTTLDCSRKRCLYQWATDPQPLSFPLEYEISSSLVCHARLHPSVPRCRSSPPPPFSYSLFFSAKLDTHVSRTCVGSGADKDLFSVSLFLFWYFLPSLLFSDVYHNTRKLRQRKYRKKTFQRGNIKKNYDHKYYIFYGKCIIINSSLKFASTSK